MNRDLVDELAKQMYKDKLDAYTQGWLICAEQIAKLIRTTELGDKAGTMTLSEIEKFEEYKSYFATIADIFANSMKDKANEISM